MQGPQEAASDVLPIQDFNVNNLLRDAIYEHHPFGRV